MQLHCLTEHLAEGLAVVGRVVPTRATLPVLGNVLLEAAEGELRLVATDLTTTVSHRLAATTGAPGRTTLPARLLADYVGLLDRGQAATLALDPGTHKVHLACGRYAANIAVIDADDFPPVLDVSAAHAVTLAARALKEAIRQVAFAAAPDDTRPVLAGILLRSSSSSLTLAAADGFRLAVRTLDLPAVAPDLPLIVPARAMAEVARLLPDGAGHQVTISASADGHQVRFAFARTELVSRLIDGQFPDYERIIPAQASTTAIVATSDFLRATRVAGVFARDNSHIVRLEAAPTPNGTGSPELAIGRLVVRAASNEMGDNEGAIDATVAGGQAAIAFNSRYLRDALEAIDTRQVRLQINSPGQPGVLRPVGSDSEHALVHVVMPLSVGR